LGDSKDPLAVDLLLEVIDDENEFVRASAINSLGRIGDEKALKFLVEKTSDYSEEVRYALVKSLAKFPQDGAKICLKRIAKSDPSNQVKRAARAALDKK
jgi:HEAT repeat protein